MKIIFAYNYSELATINNKTPVPEFISYKLERFFFLPMKRYFRWNLLKEQKCKVPVILLPTHPKKITLACVACLCFLSKLKAHCLLLQNGTLKIIDRKKNIFKLSQVRILYFRLWISLLHKCYIPIFCYSLLILSEEVIISVLLSCMDFLQNILRLIKIRKNEIVSSAAQWGNILS